MSQLPAAQRSLLPVVMGMMPAALSVSQAASSSSHVVGGVTPCSARSGTLYQSTLVTSAVCGTSTTLPSTDARRQERRVEQMPASGPSSTASVRSAA